MTILNTIRLQQGKKAKPNDKNFNRFIKNCIEELNKNKKTICYTYEQVEALKLKYAAILKYKKIRNDIIEVEVALDK